MDMKTCPVCKIAKPADSHHFHKRKVGLASYCKHCHSQNNSAPKANASDQDFILEHDPPLTPYVLSRSERRKGRARVINEINTLTENHCDVCPVNRNQSLHECHPCPIFKQLGELGEQMLLISKRVEKVKIFTLKEPKVQLTAKGIPISSPSRKAFLEEKAKGNNNMKEIALLIGTTRPTLYKWLKRWGFIGITPEDAQDLLDQMSNERQT